ncbi:MAG TPA: hypothetical protein VH325_09620 [Bryobacteraceae bacterium]|nr:hypothetical protein [Bryobacteraceae bacterium]
MPTESLIKASKDTETKSSSLGSKTTATSIKFGKPSQNTQPSSGNSTNWTQLASSAAGGGLSSLLGGGAGVLGLGSIVSGLLGLFGGGSKTPPPLTLFELPASQDVTIYAGNNSATVYQGSMDQTVTSKSQTPIYSTPSNGTSAKATAATPLVRGAGTNANTPTAASKAPPHAPSGASTTPTPASVAPTDVNSQWFMERSGDIAAAVRNAMLNSSSLNDVIAEV